MDSERFDRIAKAVGNPASRRGMLRLLSGGALAGLWGGLGVEGAAACVRLTRKWG